MLVVYATRVARRNEGAVRVDRRVRPKYSHTLSIGRVPKAMRDIRRQEGRLLRAYFEFGAINIDDRVSFEDDDTFLTVVAMQGNRCARIEYRDAVRAGRVQVVPDFVFSAR